MNQLSEAIDSEANRFLFNTTNPNGFLSILYGPFGGTIFERDIIATINVAVDNPERSISQLTAFDMFPIRAKVVPRQRTLGGLTGGSV